MYWRLFNHFTADYTCKQCHHVHSVAEPTFAMFHAVVGLLAATPVSIAAMRAPWHFPWYCVFPILAGEFLAVFIAGFLGTIPIGLISLIGQMFSRDGTIICGKCGGKRVLTGRHLDPVGERLPRVGDMVFVVVFALINSIFWAKYVAALHGAA